MISHVGRSKPDRDSASGWRYAVPVVLVALLGTLVSIGLMQRQQRAIHGQTHDSVQAVVSSTAQTAARSLGSLRGAMAAFPAFYAVTQPVSEAEFAQFSAVTFDQRDDLTGVLFAAPRASSLVVEYLASGAPANLRGFDLASDPVSAKATELARSSRDTVMVARRSSPLGGSSQVFAYTPLFQAGTFTGVVVAGVDVWGWLDATAPADDAYALSLLDESVTPYEVLWASGNLPVSDQTMRVALPVSDLQTLTVTGGPGPAMTAAAQPWRPWAWLVAGLLVTACLCTFIWVHSRRVKGTADDLQQATNRLRFLAERDALTGLTHRDGLRSWLEEWDSRAAGRPLVVLSIDLDGFKEVNTRWGHLSGDLVLRQIAHRLSSLIDDRDCVVARISGDQFVVMRALDLGSLDDITGSVQALIEEPIPIGDRDIALSSSIGVALRPQDGHNLDTLITNADVAVRAAKELPGNSVVRFDQGMAAHAAREQQIGRAFRAAMRDPAAHFTVDFQPQVDMVSGRLVAAEALIRWNRDGELVSPAEFLPVATAYKLMPDLGRWILRESCLVVRRWRQEVPAVVAVNVDAQQLETGFADVITGILQDTGTSPEWLMIEVTEAAAMGVRAQRELDRIRALGMSISIDDFGTGFSSLSRLADLPVQQLKIDRAFVVGLGQSNETLEIVRTIVALARALELETLAEGVETVAQARALLNEGVRIGQGFLFSAPTSADACLAMWHAGVSVPQLQT